jgi:hypothetical protein
MFLKVIDLTTALRPSYLPDEVLLFVQDNVGLYEGYVYIPMSMPMPLPRIPLAKGRTERGLTRLFSCTGSINSRTIKMARST